MPKKKPSRIWRAFEAAPGLARAAVEWQRLLGPEFEKLWPHLRARQQPATSVPCPAKRSCGCYHRVVSHAHDDLVAVCRCEDRRCPTISVARAEVVVYEVHAGGLGAAIAVALGAKAEDRTVEGIPATWQVGTYSPRVGTGIPLYMTIQIGPNELRAAAEGLLARSDKPFVLLSPTEVDWKPENEDLMRRGQARFLALAEILDWNGKLSAKQPLPEILADFIEKVLPPTTDQYELQKEGKTWRAVYRGVPKSVPDSKGMAYIAVLLSAPNKEIHCTQLYAGLSGPASSSLSGIEPGLLVQDGIAVGDDDHRPQKRGKRVHVDAVLDREGVATYKRRLAKIKEGIEEARELGETEKAANLAQEEHAITQGLARSLGYGGQPRREGPTKRASQAVSKAIKAAMKAIRAAHPTLYAHLEPAIKAGEFPIYRAEADIRWRVGK